MGLRDLERLLAVPGFEDPIALRLQDDAGQVADAAFVFDQQNRLGAAGRRLTELSWCNAFGGK